MKEVGVGTGKTSICDGPDAMSANRNVPLRGIAVSMKREAAPAAVSMAVEHTASA
ncbi:MAG TPA: hypothetical protein VFL79_13390 [Terriglobia bacterium]|nr:hypothetical protein [Terriglobia bacterium]